MRSLIQQPSSKFNKENYQPLHQVTRGWRSPQLEHTHKVCTAAHMDSTRQVRGFPIMQKPDEVMRMGHSAQRLIAMCHTTREIFHQDAQVSTAKVLRCYQLHPPPPRTRGSHAPISSASTALQERATWEDVQQTMLRRVAVSYLVWWKSNGPHRPVVSIKCLHQTPRSQVIQLQLPCLGRKIHHRGQISPSAFKTDDSS